MGEINKEIGISNGVKILHLLSDFYPGLTWKEEFDTTVFYLNDLNLIVYSHNYQKSTLQEFVDWNNEIFIRKIRVNEKNEMEVIE